MPKIKVRVFNEKKYISLEDHLSEIERYKSFIRQHSKKDDSWLKALDILFNGRKA